MSQSKFQYSGPIAWMTKNSVAANLLMALLFVSGLVGLFTVKQVVFPEISMDTVLVAVPYPGASPSEVEQGIVLAVEEAVRGVDGVKRITSVSSEGGGSVNVELLLSADKDKALADTKGAVDRILTFPEDAERPEVRLLTPRAQVISLVISGDQDAATLHAVAEQARTMILEHPDVTQVEFEGIRPLEVSVDMPRAALESLGMTLDQVANQIKAASLELPVGAVKADQGEVLVRVADRKLTGTAFEDVVIRATASGSMVRLGDVANIRDDYEEIDLFGFFNGKPAVRVVAYRVGDETPQRVADAVREVQAELEATLPAVMEVSVWDDDSQVLRDRISLLVRNAASGGFLVFLVLATFLELRLAVWVALGIPISFFGAFALMPLLGMSINMITLFAFIVTLGMVVDDAIIVGENIYTAQERGEKAIDAAVKGAQQMAMPVTFSILTTMAAFAPLMFVPGFMGKIFNQMPQIVILVLIFSLLESFFVLPAHLGHSSKRPLPKPLRFFGRLSTFMSSRLEKFGNTRYGPFLDKALTYRYISVGAGLMSLIMTLGVVAGGLLPFNFFPAIEGDVVKVLVRMPIGTPVERTLVVREAIERAAESTIVAFDIDREDADLFTVVGQGAAGFGPAGGTRENGAHLLTVELELPEAATREFSALDCTTVWEKNTPELAGIEAIVFQHASGPSAGKAVDAQLSHPENEMLGKAAAEMSLVLGTYPSLTNVDNTFASGKEQLNYHILPSARTVGLTAVDVARQIRGSFFGSQALREQRGRNEIRVMVRLPREERASEFDLQELWIRTPLGRSVPLSSVASFDRGTSPTSIARESGQRVVSVTADRAPGTSSTSDVLASLTEETFPMLQEKYPGLTIQFVGEQREQAETMAALGRNALIAAFVMYALLAIPFRSYLQPIVVMAAIPMGLVGAVLGHIIMGYDLSIISGFGVVALSGVVVNDSLVLIDAANTARTQGVSAYDAIMLGGKRRLRPILLTSLTTFFGLAPMIFETSMQARFLIPMAISLGFGVLFATGIILVLVPALYLIVEDLTDFLALVTSGDDEPVPVIEQLET
ncbi:MAG: AcrB/AcrD/AcrF family protein [Rhodobacterales bacterium]|nr:AcrB/AcrD/AcrF family protein [Rhodobacterales bacterium]